MPRAVVSHGMRSMTRSSLFRLMVASAVIIGSTLACHVITDTVSLDFTIHVDSITGPNAVSGGIAANAYLWGAAGSNGCTRFKELRTTRKPSQIDVTVVGEHVSGASCLGGTALVAGVELRLEPPILNDFLIVVHQPDGTTLTRRIYGE
jgi:hypothetical protein